MIHSVECTFEAYLQLMLSAKTRPNNYEHGILKDIA